MHLRISGPTPLPPEVVAASAKPMIDPRSPESVAIFREITNDLKELLETTGDVFLMASTGTGGVEAAVSNVISPGEQVLNVSCGFFGDRVGDIAEAFGAKVQRLVFPDGDAADPKAVENALQQAPDTKVVMLTQHETWNGVVNPVEEIAAIARRANALVLVDAVSSLGAMPLRMDPWGVDVVASVSQKGLMSPPGLACVAVSERAWEHVERAKASRFYFDLRKAKRVFKYTGLSPWTPPVSLLYAVQAALRLMRAEGFANVFQRHDRVAALTRSRLAAANISLVARKPEWASNAVTAVYVPPTLKDIEGLLKLQREKYDVVFTGAQMKGKKPSLRIGHIGHVNERDMEIAIDLLDKSLREHGWDGQPYTV